MGIAPKPRYFRLVKYYNSRTKKKNDEPKSRTRLATHLRPAPKKLAEVLEAPVPFESWTEPIPSGFP